MDIARPQCCACQCRKWTHRVMGFVHLYRMDPLHVIPRPQGAILARSHDRLHREWTNYVLYDRYDFDFVWLGILHRCHRRSRNIWYAFFGIRRYLFLTLLRVQARSWPKLSCLVMEASL